MGSAVPHLRLLRDDDPPAPQPVQRKKKSQRPMPGLYRPTSPCRKCSDCTATPKRTCRQKIEQSVWVLRRRIKGISFQASTGCSDKRAAMDAAKKLLEDWEREAVGLPPKDKGRQRLDDVLEKFQKSLRGGRGKEKQQQKVMRFLHEVIDEARKVAALDFVDELSDEVYTDWLPYAEERNLANRTINDRIRVLKRFGKWLRAKRLLPYDPFEILALLPDKKDLRRVRRALWPRECAALIHATLRRQGCEECVRNAESNTGLTPGVLKRRRRRMKDLRYRGYARALVYFTILRTGLRRDECRRIRVCDVRPSEGRIRVPPDVAKGGVEQFVQMDKVLARHLRSYIRRLGAVDRAVPLFGFTRIVKMKGETEAKEVQFSRVPSMTTFYKDLVAAGIPRKDDMDRVVDVHALRKSFITHLRMQGVEAEDARRLARHSDVKLTLDVYSDYEKLAVRETTAAEKLVGLWRSE